MNSPIPNEPIVCDGVAYPRLMEAKAVATIASQPKRRRGRVTYGLATMRIAVRHRILEIDLGQDIGPGVIDQEREQDHEGGGPNRHYGHIPQGRTSFAPTEQKSTEEDQ